MCICLGGTIRTRILGSEDIVIILGFDALSGALGGQCNDYWAYYRLGMVAIQTHDNVSQNYILQYSEYA